MNYRRYYLMTILLYFKNKHLTSLVPSSTWSHSLESRRCLLRNSTLVTRFVEGTPTFHSIKHK